MAGIHELFPGKLFIAHGVCAGAIGGGSAEGDVIVDSFGEVPEAIVGGLVRVSGLAALLCKIPQGYVLGLPEIFDRVFRGELHE